MDARRAATAFDRMLAAARPGRCSTIIGHVDVPAHIRAAFDSPAARATARARLPSGPPHPALDPSNALSKKEI